MAECMGLHRDGSAYGMNPLETHVRRLVWYQLCFLDIRTCEAQGPRPSMRREEFDTKLPLNVNDIDLHATGKVPTAADHWTDATFCLMRFEINEMMRTIVTIPFLAFFITLRQLYICLAELSGRRDSSRYDNSFGSSHESKY